MNAMKELPEQVAYIQGMVVALGAANHTMMTSYISDEIVKTLDELRDDILRICERKEQSRDND